MAKMHFAHPAPEPGPATVALCGWLDVPVTTSEREVRCKRCLRALVRGVHLELAPPPPFEPSGPYEVPPAARALDGRALAAIARSISGVEERRYRWRSAAEALQSLAVFRADGQGVGSTSHPARFERLPRGASDPTRQVTADVDRHLGVDAARAQAFTGSRTLTWTRCSCGAERVCEGHEPVIEALELTAAQQLQILDWSMEMRVVRGATHMSASSLVQASAERVAQRAIDAWGIRLTEHHVTLIKRAGLRAVSAYLREIGEMAPPENEAGKEDEMAVRGFELSGWEQIERYTGLGRDALRRLAARVTDPLPVKQIEGVRGYHARKADIDAWLERNQRQAMVSTEAEE